MSPESAKVPQHLAIIMDGNGRWATSKGLPRFEGHRRGAEVVTKILDAVDELGIQIVTLYAFSTENWGRPQDEVKGLMALLEFFMRDQRAQMIKKQTRLRVIGDVSRLPADTLKSLNETLEATKNFNRRTLVLALNYSGRDEIVRATNKLIAAGQPATWADIEGALDTAGIPDPDLIIRTSGELRLSNFMMLQAAYSEFYFSPTPWPEFSVNELHDIIANYASRQRRFGKTGQQVTKQN